MTKSPRLEEWQQDMIRAVPDSLLRDIVNDSRPGVSQRSSLASRPQQTSEPARPVSGGTTPIRPPAGVKWLDRLLDAQDALDRAHAVRVRDELVEAAMRDKVQYAAKTSYDPFSRERMGFSDDDE